MNSPTYHRKGFGLKDQVEDELKSAYDSGLISDLKTQGGKLVSGRFTILLAQAFGFCWGVDRAVSMAYETRKFFPDKKIWITNEIIHNPLVNSHLKDMQIEFLPVEADGRKNFELISPGEVVIIPAFGASVAEIDDLSSKGCEIVDTTCPWVSRVWVRIMKYADGKYTALIHGKYNHEETIATASRAKKYLIVQNLDEAKWVCDYVLNGGAKEEFLGKFQKACSQGFDPDTDLISIGIANQTTMLKGETEEIGKLFEKTMLTKYGPQKLDSHFLSPGDTICDATQERQDAMLQLIEEKLDLMIIIGGFNSSNTGHLREIAESKNIPAFQIDDPSCLISKNKIRYLAHQNQVIEEERDWLPQGEITIGVTAGASTPNQVVEEVIEKLKAWS
jgi:4-hydroxy-3-methylbut-2-enyl diphosphate reductase